MSLVEGGLKAAPSLSDLTTRHHSPRNEFVVIKKLKSAVDDENEVPVADDIEQVGIPKQILWLLCPAISMSGVAAIILWYKFRYPLLYWHHLFLAENQMSDSSSTTKRLVFGLDDCVSSFCAWSAVSLSVPFVLKEAWCKQHLKLVLFTGAFSLGFWLLRDMFVFPFGRLEFFLTDYGIGPPWLIGHGLFLSKIVGKSTGSKSNYWVVFGITFAFTSAVGVYLFGINILFALPGASENFRSLVRLLLHPPLRAGLQYFSLGLCYYLDGHDGSRIYALLTPITVFLSLAGHVMLSSMEVWRSALIIVFSELFSELAGQRLHLLIARCLFKHLSPDLRRYHRDRLSSDTSKTGSRFFSLKLTAPKVNPTVSESKADDEEADDGADVQLPQQKRLSDHVVKLRGYVEGRLSAAKQVNLAPLDGVVGVEQETVDFVAWFSRGRCRRSRMQHKVFNHLVDIASVPFGVMAVYLMHTTWSASPYGEGGSGNGDGDGGEAWEAEDGWTQEQQGRHVDVSNLMVMGVVQLALELATTSFTLWYRGISAPDTFLQGVKGRGPPCVHWATMTLLYAVTAYFFCLHFFYSYYFMILQRMGHDVRGVIG